MTGGKNICFYQLFVICWIMNTGASLVSGSILWTNRLLLLHKSGQFSLCLSKIACLISDITEQQIVDVFHLELGQQLHVASTAFKCQKMRKLWRFKQHCTAVMWLWLNKSRIGSKLGVATAMKTHRTINFPDTWGGRIRLSTKMADVGKFLTALQRAPCDRFLTNWWQSLLI